MLIKKLKFILCVFIPFFYFFLMSHNTFALTKDYNYFSFFYNTPQSQTFINSGQTSYNYLRTNIHAVQIMAFALNNIGSVPNNSNYLTISAKFNFVTFTDNNSPSYLPSTSEIPELYNVTVNGDTVSFSNSSVDVYVTDWVGDPFDVGINSNLRTFTYNFSCVIPNIPSSINSLTLAARYYNLPLYTSYSGGFNSFFEYDANNFAQIEFSNDINSAILQQQVQNQNTIINQNQQIIENQNQNTQDIIDNQNQNTQDIIRSNQKCYYKNLWKFNSSYSTTSNSWVLPDTEFILPAGTYTFSFTSNPAGSTARLSYKYSDNVSHIVDVSSSGTTITFTSELKKIALRLSANTSISNIMLEKGSSATSYVPYGEEFCSNVNEDYYDEQRQADQNISNQNTSDIDGATNQQTTNLIGTISSFVSALSSINTNGSCQLTLPFPSLLGGNQVVNPCNGAEKAPAIITAASSLLLITVFVPLAFILVKMIYNEIRSFTNG